MTEPELARGEEAMAATLEMERPPSKRLMILAAAIDQFGLQGYEHTKWAGVADQVGISQAALYHYFESKAHCLLSIMTLELGRSLDRFRHVTADVEPATKALEAAIEAAYDISPHEVLQMRILQNYLDLLATPRASVKEEAEREMARRLVREIAQQWARLLERGMDAGDLPKRDPHALASLVLAMTVSVWRWYRPDGPMTLEEVRELISGACLRVVGPPPVETDASPPT